MKALYQNYLTNDPKDAINDWKTDIADDFEFHPDSLKFIFAQAEKKLEETNKVYESTTTKSITLITLLSGLFITQSTYFVANNNFNGSFNPKLAAVLLSAILTFLLLRYIVVNILPTSYHSIGSLPSRLFTTEFFNSEIGDKTISFLYATEIETYEVKIDYNLKLNLLRLKRIRYTVMGLVFLPFAVLAFYTSTAIFLAFLV